MSQALESRFDVAVELAERAAELAMEMRPPPGTARGVLKGPQNWVTEADTAVEQLISEELASAFPTDGFQGEEGGVSRGGTLRWVVDPIDGTANYARGGTRWAVSLGCLDGNLPVLGIVVAPALHETVWAWRGGGAWLNGSAVRAADTSDVTQAVAEIGWSRRRPNTDYLAVCAGVLAKGASLRQGGSGTLGLTDVAVGRLDLYAELHINLWDVAAALIILEEAGATVSDFMALDAGVSGNGIVACAPGLAKAFAALPGLPAPRG